MLLANINIKSILTLKKSTEVSRMLKSTKTLGARNFSLSPFSEKLSIVKKDNKAVSISLNDHNVHKISTFLPLTRTDITKTNPELCVQKLKIAQLHTSCKNEYWLDARRRIPSSLPDRFPGTGAVLLLNLLYN